MGDVLNEESEYYSKVKPRRPFIAFLLSLLLPGLGQVYNGQLKKAFLFPILLLLNPLFFGTTRWVTFFYGYVFLIVIELTLRICTVVDAIRNAKRQKNYITKIYNTWYYQLLIGLTMLTVFWLYNTTTILGIQSFKIPTPSGEPTIETGDYLIADMKAYKNKRPNCGDLVIFKKEDGEIYTSRVIGLPNDILELNNDIVAINGKKSQSTFITDTIIDQFELSKFEEILPNNHLHNIYKSKQFDSTKTNLTNIVVPENSYYLLGDNRDNALDSRYIGAIDSNKIIGRILYSYWGKSLNRINVDFRDK